MMDHNAIFDELDNVSDQNAIKGEPKIVELKTGIDPLFFAETMTTDVELTDAIFDLIDNSIDAARNIIISSGDYDQDEYGLPSNYSEYEIRVDLSSQEIIVADNCFGIDSDSIEDGAFYTGRKSSHKYGIGYYGLGLKRALLKAGNSFSIQSDNGNNLYVADFSYEMLSGDKEKALKARKYPTQEKYGTILAVSNLKTDVINQILNLEWFDDFLTYLAIRYSIFIQKGLKIAVRNKICSDKEFAYIDSKLPAIKQGGVISKFKHNMVCDEVSIYFDVGVHQKYIFPGEHNSDPKQNKRLTGEYGIYIICNDRVIVANSFEKKYGFTTSFHSEYNGFLCYVRMISENPASLPWNTTKTEIKVHSPLFVEAKKPIEFLALKYRTQAKAVIKAWLDKDVKHLPEDKRREAFYNTLNIDNPKSDPDSKPDPDPEPSSSPKPKPSSSFDPNPNPDSDPKPKPKPSPKPKPRPEENLDRDRDIFVNWNNCNIDIPRHRKKEYEIFSDICRLSSKETPIACVVMLRVFLETSVKQVTISMNLEWQNLSKSTSRVVDGLHQTSYISDGVKEIIKQYSNTQGGMFSINNIQSMVHSTSFHPNKSMVNTYWDELEPFLAACWKFINDNEEVTN